MLQLMVVCRPAAVLCRRCSADTGVSGGRHTLAAAPPRPHADAVQLPAALPLSACTGRVRECSTTIRCVHCRAYAAAADQAGVFISRSSGMLYQARHRSQFSGLIQRQNSAALRVAVGSLLNEQTPAHLLI